MAESNNTPKYSEEWSRTQECGSYIGLTILLWTYKITGVAVLRIILYPVVLFYLIFNSAARTASQEYLKIIHEFMGAKSPWNNNPNLITSYHHFMSFGQAAIDKVIVWMGGFKEKDITILGYEMYTSLKKNGRGVVIICSHLGNVDVCRSVASRSLGIPMTILMHKANAPNFHRIFSEVAGKQSNVEFIEVQNITPDIAIRLKEKIEAGETIVIAGDRTPVESELRYEVVSFLGKDAPFAHGPFILSSLLDCPVVLLFSMKHNNGYQVSMELFSSSLKITRKHRSKNLKKYIKKYVARLEHYTCNHPLQWYNFYNYWVLPSKIRKIHR